MATWKFMFSSIQQALLTRTRTAAFQLHAVFPILPFHQAWARVFANSFPFHSWYNEVELCSVVRKTLLLQRTATAASLSAERDNS